MDFSLIDLTLLDLNARSSDIVQLSNIAATSEVAAICIYPSQIDWVPNDFSLRKAVVANFPTGQEPLSHTLAIINQVTGIVDELDYVFKNLIELKHVYTACRQAEIRLKVILETGLIHNPEQIYQLSTDVIQTGCDFLKTSTGKIKIGATLPAAQAMLLAIKNSQTNCGIKISGGIRTIKTALEYIQLSEDMLGKQVDPDWFRIGASKLFDDNKPI